jgi:hypothetical protein
MNSIDLHAIGVDRPALVGPAENGAFEVLHLALTLLPELGR